jgi:mannan endo-1,4-beta-mannosidase
MSNPITPNPSPEAIQLLEYIYSISGKYTLTGQHCIPLSGSTRLAGVEKLTGLYPVIFGQDFGFSAAGTWDGINFRQQLVDEAIRRHNDGFIITLMWHAVRPIEEEPVTFEKSILGKLTEKEWNDLLTPGTEIHEHWKSQVDVIAFFLKQLREAAVPVLWRPYHEMNGTWFWWGKKTGEMGYRKLYRMLFERLTNFHKLNNLLWVFNANELRLNVDPYHYYYPGEDVVDILATDVYSNKFADRDYRSLRALAGGKPIALGEVGNIPTSRLLRNQPHWAWFMYWHDPSMLQVEQKAVWEIYNSKETLTLHQLPWIKSSKPKTHYPVLK